jgi:hypothetical protein
MTSSSFNIAIRQAAHGRTNMPPDAVGDLGVGRGGAAGGAPRPTGNTAINDAIRAAAHRAQNRIDMDGVDLADVFGSR